MGKFRINTLLLLSLTIVKLAAAKLSIEPEDVVAPSPAMTFSHPKPNLLAKSLILVKIYCLIIVFSSTFLGGISPYFFRWNSSFLLLGTQFAGGVFFATALIHFLSDSHGGFADLTTNSYPLGEMLAVAGYMLTMFGDVVIQWVSLRAPKAAPPSLDEEGVIRGEAQIQGGERLYVPSFGCRTLRPKTPTLSREESGREKFPVTVFLNHESTATWRGKAAKMVGDEEEEGNGTICSCNPDTAGICKVPPANPIPKPTRSADAEIPAPPEVKATLVHRTSFGDALLLIFALCFHSVFEGIAIGIAETQRDAWRALWTVSLHKVFAAVAMGIALLRMIPNRPLLSGASYSFAFAISSPLGVAIGIIIDATTQGATADWVYAISLGLAAGVFIYVAINHLLAKGYVPTSELRVDKPFHKYLAVTVGAAVIAIVMIWEP